MSRLELMASTITARLAVSVSESLTREVEKVYYWTDSTTVLAWIRRDTQWGNFVWNRVKGIRTISKKEDWRHIPGEFNPADLPSRGCSPGTLVESCWWLGPGWLRSPEVEWPAGSNVIDENEVRNEARKETFTQMVNIEGNDFPFSQHFSSFKAIIRFLAWTRRFLKNRRIILENKKENQNKLISNIAYTSVAERKELCLTHQEIENAEVVLFRHLQKIMFSDRERSAITSFRTFLNEDGLHVLKTKIFNRVDDSQFLCPILLNDKHEIVRLLVRDTHERLGHAGASIVMCNLRERFWITSLRRLIRSIIASCVICKKQKVKHLECQTPPLPVNRVRDAAIFEVVGVDLAGPLYMKGGDKGWIVIFTCAVYLAVHLELASALSTEEFLECLRRFVARRGRPNTIYSDNGRNFTGASNAFKELNWKSISKYSSVAQIEWCFNPPSAPWWGGWWERLIGILTK